MGDKTGYVNGIDVRVYGPGKEIRCFAFINTNPDEAENFQVQTTDHQFQSVLQFASGNKKLVEVLYTQEGQANIVTGVRIMDRKP